MDENDDPVFRHPESYGIENLEAPGEPDRAKEPAVSPVPGTGRSAREEHMRQHAAQGETPPDSDLRRPRSRKWRRDTQREVAEAEGDLIP
jgi:hypothetical protein